MCERLCVCVTKLCERDVCVCEKVLRERVVYDKVACERECVTKLCVCVTKLCVNDGV